jgi:hypothetical protein
MASFSVIGEGARGWLKKEAPPLDASCGGAWWSRGRLQGTVMVTEAVDGPLPQTLLLTRLTV